GCGASLRGADECVRPYAGGCSIYVLVDLAEDPRICWGHSADHYGVASGLGDYGAGIFGRTDVAIADHGNLHGLFSGCDPFPARVSAVALLAGAGVQGDSSK